MRFNSIKRLVFLLFLSIFLVTYCVPVLALSEGSYTSQSLPKASITELYNRIYNGLSKRVTSISLSGISLTENDIETEVFPIAERIKAENPELFYVGQQMTVTYKSGAYYFSMNYTMTSTQIAAAKVIYYNAIEKMLEGVNTAWSDVKKITYISDYITQNYKYDIQLKIFDAYNFIRSGKGVCQAYHALFTAAMKELGIPVSYAISEEMNHIWSMVQADGEWYHIDVTHNDPVSDRIGHSFHTNMLMSDTKCAETHKPWVSDYKATSTKYDNYEWENIQTAFVYHGDKVYAIDSSTGYLITFDFNTGKSTNVLFIANRWTSSSGMTYKGCYSSLAQYGGTLYFNTDTEIFAYDVEKGKKVSIAKKSGSGYIYGFLMEDNKLTYYLASNPNVEATPASTITVEKIALYTATFKSGSVVVSQKQYAAGENIEMPTSPTKEGYKFVGWSTSIPKTMPASDITFEAVFECKHEKTLTKEADASCIHDGFIKHICTTCGDIVSNTTIKATGIHTYGEWTQNDTERKRFCTVCGLEEKEPINHTSTTSEIDDVSETPSVSEIATSSEDATNSNVVLDESSKGNDIFSTGESIGNNTNTSRSIWIIVSIVGAIVVVTVVVVITKRNKRLS